MLVRKLAGAALAALSAWVLYGRYQAMAFEVKVGDGISFFGLLSDPVYLIPGVGALLALLGGFIALLGGRGWIIPAIGTGLLVLFMALVGGLSGNLSMIQPFWPATTGMLLAVLALIFVKPE